MFYFFFQAEDGIRDYKVTGVQTCALPIFEVDGRLIGEIGTYAEPGRIMLPGLFFLSIALFRPDDRGRGLGTDAVHTLCDWLFRSAGAERIESSTAVSNAAMRGVFEKLGFA